MKSRIDELVNALDRQNGEKQTINSIEVQNIPLDRLHPFKNHPFKVLNDDELKRMAESILAIGAITPALARPLPNGEYELISGHRRLAAYKLLGKETMPVIVREMTDDEAVIVMVDANLQREKILPSERAFAYKMKLEAIKHQGKASANGPTQSADLISDESGRQIQRYIRLTYLIPELLQMVDDGRMAMSPAVEISFLKESEQRALLNAMEYCDCTPSHAQSIQLKRLSQVEALDDDLIHSIMGQPKPNQVEQIKLRRDDFSRYFPASYSAAQIKADIQKGLELLKRQRERNKNAR
jgi:ParB family chromosome partitioning protein